MSSNKNQKPGMTRKEALAVLHKVFDTVGWHLYSENPSEEEKALGDQVYDAFRIFDVAAHGEKGRYQVTGGLCHYCYLRMSMDKPLVCKKGQRGQRYADWAQPCCSSCFEQIKAEQQLAYIEVWNDALLTWEKRQPEEEGEVQA